MRQDYVFDIDRDRLFHTILIQKIMPCAPKGLAKETDCWGAGGCRGGTARGTELAGGGEGGAGA